MSKQTPEHPSMACPVCGCSNLISIVRAMLGSMQRCTNCDCVLPVTYKEK